MMTQYQPLMKLIATIEHAALIFLPKNESQLLVTMDRQLTYTAFPKRFIKEQYRSFMAPPT